MRSLRLLACLLPFAVLVAGCDEKLADLTGPTPNLQPTFASIQSQIFAASDSNGRPACRNCHVAGGIGATTGLLLGDANTYASLVGRPARFRAGETLVIPGNPDESYLVRKLEGGPNINGVRMPFAGGPYLTSGQLLVLRRWIQLGAKND